MNKYKKELEFCKKIASEAGNILFKGQDDIKIINQKDSQDIATNADISSEKYLIDKILKKYPNHGICSEEKGEINPKAEFKWIIDPLDGTKEYIRNLPMWNISIALQYRGETVVSVVSRPYENIIYSAGKGLGSFRNNDRLSVSKTDDIKNSFVYCYVPSYKRQQEKYDWAFDKLKQIGKKVYRLRTLSNGNTGLCWLSQGSFDAYINLTNPPKSHDILPGLFIAKEAGAYNTVNNIPLVITNNKKIYCQLMDIIKN